MEAKTRVMSGSKRSRLLRVLTILIPALVALLLVAGVNIALAQADDPPWKVTIEDCYGADQQVTGAEDSNVPSCQSYQADLYESLEYGNPPVEDADIQTFSLGWDNDYVYIEWNMVGALSAVSEGHWYIVELDVDDDDRGDYYFRIEGKVKFTGTSWVYADDEVLAYFDNINPNDVGGANLTAPDWDTGPGSGGAQDGYETAMVLTGDQSLQTDVYARIIAGNVQMAILRSTIGLSSSDTDILARGTTSQASSIEPTNLYWHDENPSSALDTSELFDNTGWTPHLPNMDYGDLHENHSLTLFTDDGPRHMIGNLKLGDEISAEFDGTESDTAEGDIDPDDDGIVALGNWSDGTGSLQVNVTGGDGCLFGWLDYKSGVDGYDGTFESSETLLYNKPVSSSESQPIIIPISNFINPIPANALDDKLTFARFRLLPMIDEGCYYGSFSINSGDPLDMLKGANINGEVEDYFWTFGPNAVSMASFSASSDSVPAIWIAVAALLSLIGVTAFAWIRRRTA